MMHPEKYAAALCMSGAGSDPTLSRPSVLKRRDDGRNPWAQAKINVEEGKELPKMFMSVGDKDFTLEGMRTCRDYLKELGYDVTYEEIPGYGHEWDFWDLTLRKAIKEWLPIRHSAIYPED